MWDLVCAESHAQKNDYLSQPLPGFFADRFKECPCPLHIPHSFVVLQASSVSVKLLFLKMSALAMVEVLM